MEGQQRAHRAEGDAKCNGGLEPEHMTRLCLKARSRLSVSPLFKLERPLAVCLIGHCQSNPSQNDSHTTGRNGKTEPSTFHIDSKSEAATFLIACHVQDVRVDGTGWSSAAAEIPRKTQSMNFEIVADSLAHESLET
eukprot:TRINITY_DN63450_c0_g1_i1.p2 TRINITY_DN63450_c0_g1~~TRINITY_DN63450_c0_g1_i1.p2  ORF type:complete len:137 (-),score=7.80 TRINITY_DN63450_c0_g1_i1:628-1038(-)